MAQRSVGDVIDDLREAFRVENGAEFHRLVQLLHLLITPSPEQVTIDVAQLQPFGHGELADLRQKPDPHLQHIERMLLQGLYYLSAIYAQNRRLLMNAADINAKLDRINDATNNIAADIRTLTGQIGTGMSQADVDAVAARLESSATALEAIAAQTPDVPPVVVPGTATPAQGDGSTLSGETGAGTGGRVGG